MRISVIVLAIFLSSCGGGGGGEAVAPLAPQGLIDLALARGVFDVGPDGDGGDGGGDGGVGGSAGDGSPLAGAVVFLTDSQGKTVTGQTDAKGGYLLRFKTADFKAPFVLKVIDAGGSILASANEIVIPAGKAARVNINPLTDKVVSDVLSAATSGTDKVFDGASVNTAGLAQAKTNLLTSIQAALVVAGVPDSKEFDPVRSAYKHDGTGVDAIIESISHVRIPGTGATQLQAKLAPLVTNADGTVVPTVISASTPLAASQVAIASNPALTFSKITAWVDLINRCLKLPNTVATTGECSDASFASKMISPAYKHNSKDQDEDFNTLNSESDGSHVVGSEFRNPNILFIGRSAGSSIDDVAVVEMTIRQPRTGPRDGNLTTPIEYTKILVFRRDDAAVGLVAGNWILHGNQRNFDWGVTPRYYTSLHQNPASAFKSRVIGSIVMNFNNTVFDRVSKSFVASNVYAVRLTGPGLPTAGVVYAPTSVATSIDRLTILNKTGEIPVPGTKSTRVQRDFRLGAADLATKAIIADATFSGPNTTDTPVDFSRLQAFSRYTAEIFINGQTAPIVETTTILAPLASPLTQVNRPLHDLSPTIPSVLPPQAASSSVVARWNRRPDAVRIESAYFFSATGFVQNANISTFLSDALALNPTSTSVTISSPGVTLPAMTGAVGDQRAIGLFGRAARTEFTQEVIWSRENQPAL